MNFDDSIKAAIKRAGGVQSVASDLGVSVRAVYKWIDTKVPADRAIQLEQITEGAVTVRELRPDLFETTAA